MAAVVLASLPGWLQYCWQASLRWLKFQLPFLLMDHQPMQGPLDRLFALRSSSAVVDAFAAAIRRATLELALHEGVDRLQQVGEAAILPPCPAGSLCGRCRRACRWRVGCAWFGRSADPSATFTGGPTRGSGCCDPSPAGDRESTKNSVRLLLGRLEGHGLQCPGGKLPHVVARKPGRFHRLTRRRLSGDRLMVRA